MRDRRRRVDDNSGRGATTNGVTARRGQTLDPPAPKCGLGMGKTIRRTFCGLQLVFGTAGECGKRAGRYRLESSLKFRGGGGVSEYESQIPDLGVTDATESIPAAMSGSAH